MRIYAVTKKGKNKADNEDRLLINKTILSDGCFFVDEYKDTGGAVTILAVADGVGGNNAGATASHFVSGRLSDLRNNEPEYLRTHIKSINTELIEKSNANPDFHKMATTLSGLAITDGQATLFHIGNTRIFTTTNKYLKQITTDHTEVGTLLRTGKLTEDEAAVYSRRNVINACLGANDENLIHSLIVENIQNFENMARIVMTSDGVHEYVSIDEMEDILEIDTGNLEKCRMIVDKALQNGSTDDISIILVV